MRFLYVDHNATTPVRSEVREAMLAAMRDGWANPSSPHRPGAEARRRVETARAEVAGLCGCSSSEIIFTSGGTESNNLALLGAAWAARQRGRHVIVSSIEHHAVARAAIALEQEGWEVSRLPVDSRGLVDPAALAKNVRSDTTVVSVMWANNETGVVQRIGELASIARGWGALFHTDAVQVPGRLPIDLAMLDVDLLAISGHKIYGPKGVGALYIRDGTALQPVTHGGGQERGLRSGTLDVPGIVGLGEACRLLGEEGERYARQLAARTDHFESLLRSRFPDVVVHGGGASRIPGTTSFSIPGLDAESLVIGLDLEGVSASAGPACTTGSFAPSHVLRAMGVAEDLVRGAVRISFGRDNDDTDVTALIEALSRVGGRMARR